MSGEAVPTVIMASSAAGLANEIVWASSVALGALTLLVGFLCAYLFRISSRMDTVLDTDHVHRPEFAALHAEMVALRERVTRLEGQEPATDAK